MAEEETPVIPKGAKGFKFAKGTNWKLTAMKGERELKATCLGTVEAGNMRIAMFKVPKLKAG